MEGHYTTEGLLEQVDFLNEKWVDKIINLVIEKIFWWELNDENAEEFRKFINRFKKHYFGMKDEFDWVERSSWERYFEHLREVVNNVLDLPNPNLDKVYAAILHDVIEDRPKYNFGVLNAIAGEKVALMVQAISKEPSENYHWDAMDTNEKAAYVKPPYKFTDEVKKKAKILRNEEYFSHMESFDSMKNHISELAEEKGIELTEGELDEVTQDTLDVKFADRIHNLSTQWHPEKTDWVVRKMEETVKYFLPVAKATNQEAYNQMMEHLSRLRVQLFNVWVNVEYILDNKEGK